MPGATQRLRAQGVKLCQELSPSLPYAKCVLESPALAPWPEDHVSFQQNLSDTTSYVKADTSRAELPYHRHSDLHRTPEHWKQRACLRGDELRA